MERNPENRTSERILRLLQARFRSQPRSVDDARVQLEQLVQAAKDGHPNLVGLDDHVVLVSIDTLCEVFVDLEQSENWGEYFATAYDGLSDSPDIPMKRYGGRATYTLDTTSDDAEAEKED